MKEKRVSNGKPADNRRLGRSGKIHPWIAGALLAATAAGFAQSDLPVSTVRRKEAAPAPEVPFKGEAVVSPQPRYFLDTVDTLNRFATDRERKAPGLTKNNYVGKVYEIRNAEACELQCYLLRMLAFEGGTCEVMGADDVTDEKGKVQYLFVTAPDFMIPGIDEIVQKCDRKGFRYNDSTTKNFGGGPGAIQYVGKHRTASELVAILKGTELGNLGVFFYPPFADDSTNRIYLAENPTDIADDLAALESFDQPPLQVELECTIYEVDATDGGTLGLDWDAWKRHLSGSLTYSSLGGDNFADNDVETFDTVLRLDAQAIVEFLNFTVQRSHARVITSTKITMVNSEDLPGALAGGGARGAATGAPAVIESLVHIPFTVLQTDVGATNSTNARNEVVDTAFEGVRVEILPFIGTQSITMRVNAQVNSLIGYSKGNKIPIVSTRRVNSVVNLKDGKPVVLGGLEKTTINDSAGGIVGLIRIPVLRYLFGVVTRDNQRRSQIVIALKPRIKAADADEPVITQIIPKN